MGINSVNTLALSSKAQPTEHSLEALKSASILLASFSKSDKNNTQKPQKSVNMRHLWSANQNRNLV